MASHTGSEGLVKVGANTVSEVTSWSLDETGETIETTSMGDSARSYAAGLVSWSASVEVLWDETDTNGQVALSVGSSVSLNLHPEGATSGDTIYSGTGLVTSHSKTASFDGMVTASIGLTGTGGLTTSTV